MLDFCICSSVGLFLGFLVEFETLRKKSNTWEFDFRKAFYDIKLLQKKLTTHKKSPKYIFNASNTIMKLFLTIVYI